MNDEMTLRDHKVVKGSKIMVVGSKVTEVMAVNEPGLKVSKDLKQVETAVTKEPLSKQKVDKAFNFFVILIVVFFIVLEFIV